MAATRKSEAVPRLAYRPLTPERWKDFEALFGERGACGGCWCMWWRLARPEFERGKGAGNRRAMKEIVASGEVPGILTGRRTEAIRREKGRSSPGRHGEHRGRTNDDERKDGRTDGRTV